MDNFADRLIETMERKRSHVVVGLDPDHALLPPDLVAVPAAPFVPAASPEAAPAAGGEAGLAGARDVSHSPDSAEKEETLLGTGQRRARLYRTFLLALIDRLAPVAAAVKIQLAYFEALGPPGWSLYHEVVAEARERQLIVIADAKRGDIGSTAEAYAQAHLDVAGADAVTVNPWFGSDGVEPFLRRAREEGKGVFLLVKTSNPSSAEIQDLRLPDGRLVFEQVASLLHEWSEGTKGSRGYASVGAVVGATHPSEARALRVLLPAVPFLIPGYGAQGGKAEDLRGLFDGSGMGAVVNASRSILYAYRSRPGSWLEAAYQEAENMRRALWKVSQP
jgi:orotidine-5'-phosphate decarboxylase